MTSPGASDGSGGLRIGDHERADAVHALGEHYAQGRLEFPEYENRTREAAAAVTHDQLRALFQDLPAPWPTSLVPHTPVGPMPPPPAQPGSPHINPLAMESDRSKVAAGLLQIFLPFGIGRFYTGHTGIAVGQLLLFWLGLFTCGVGTLAGFVWSVIDGIVLLASDSTDAYGRPLRR